MDDKAFQLVNEMKTQTIGVEVEMNNITRQKAAQKIATFFDTEAFYGGGEYGYSAWACHDQKGRVWKFQSDASIDGPSSSCCELVTPILTYKDIKVLQEVVRILRKSGGRSSPSRGCGVHIHIGLGNHTPQSLRNLVNIMAKHETKIAQAIRLAPSRLNRWCQVVNPEFLKVLNKVKPNTFHEMKKIWYETDDDRRVRARAGSHYDSSRYRMLNLHATWSKETIEFRLFQFDEPSDERQGGLHAGQLKAYIQLCLAMSQRAKMMKSASPTIIDHPNERYAFRNWLLSLGFIGEEFATAREIFLKNLEGSLAWRDR